MGQEVKVTHEGGLQGQGYTRRGLQGQGYTRRGLQGQGYTQRGLRVTHAGGQSYTRKGVLGFHRVTHERGSRLHTKGGGGWGTGQGVRATHTRTGGQTQTSLAQRVDWERQKKTTCPSQSP